MSAKIGALHVSLGLSSAQFETGLNKAGKKVNAFEGTLGKLGGVFKRLEGVAGSFGKGLVSGLAAGGIAGLVATLGQVASSVASIGVEAKRAGLGIKAFQELKYVAEQNKIGVSALTDGMKELSLRADEFIATGGGPAAEAFKRLGFNAAELGTKLQDPSALLSEIIGKVQGLDTSAQIRIFDEIFGGTGGEQFVQLISQGEEGIRRTVAEANSLGIVLSEEVIAKAAEVDRKFNMVANTVGTAVKGAIVEAAGALLEFINVQNEAIKRNRIMAMSNDARSRYDEQIEMLNQYLAAADRAGPAIAEDIRQIVDAYQANKISADEASTALGQYGAMNLEVFPITTGLSGVIALLDLMVGRIQTAKTQLSDLPMSYAGQDGAPPPKKPTTVPGSGLPGSSGPSAAEREAEAVKNLIAGLEFERQLIGLTAVEQAKLNALRQAGAAATEEQRIQIGNLVEATYREQEAAQLATDQMQALSDIGVSAAQSLADAFADGKIEGSELLSIVTDIVKQLLTMPTGGAGGGNWLGNIFSSLLGGLGGGGGLKLGFNLADGGHVRGPGTGRSDSIPAMLSNGEFVVNAAATKKWGSVLQHINAGGAAMKLAAGGLAMMPTGGVAKITPEMEVSL